MSGARVIKRFVEASGQDVRPALCVGCLRATQWIKPSVEGYELAVLKGALETLRRHRPVILMEYNPGAYRLADVAACLPYPARYAKVPTTYWDTLIPIELDAVRDRVDLLITPASVA